MKHSWIRRQTLPWQTCSRCGVVKSLDGVNHDAECKGLVGVAPREDAPPGDLEALIASVVKPNIRRSVEFQMTPDGTFSVTIHDYSKTLLRLTNYALATRNGPTFAAALRAAIEQIGERKEESRGA